MMNSGNFKFKVIGLQALAVLLIGVMLFYFSARQPSPAQPSIPSNLPRQLEANFVADNKVVAERERQVSEKEYKTQSDTVSGLADKLHVDEQVDLLVFIIDASSSMQNDEEDLKKSIDTIINRYKGRMFQILFYNYEPYFKTNPTDNLDDLYEQFDIKPRLDQGIYALVPNLYGWENSLYALEMVSKRTVGRYKHPALILMTDAAPNDFNFLEKYKMFSFDARKELKSYSLTDLAFFDQNLTNDRQGIINTVLSALKDANAELYIWAAYEKEEIGNGQAGAAANSAIYQELVDGVGKGRFYIVNRGESDKSWIIAN